MISSTHCDGQMVRTVTNLVPVWSREILHNSAALHSCLPVSTLISVFIAKALVVTKNVLLVNAVTSFQICEGFSHSVSPLLLKRVQTYY